MKTIYKYPIKVTPEQNIKLPIYSKILSIQVQNGQIMMWCEVEEGKYEHDHKVWVVGTGGTVPECSSHLATVQLEDYVWHIYH